MKGDVRFKTDELGLGKGRGFVRIDKLTIIFVVLISLVKKIWERNSIVVAEMQSGILCCNIIFKKSGHGYLRILQNTLLPLPVQGRHFLLDIPERRSSILCAHVWLYLMVFYAGS